MIPDEEIEQTGPEPVETEDPAAIAERERQEAEAEAARVVAALAEQDKDAEPIDLEEPTRIEIETGPSLPGELRAAGLGDAPVFVGEGYVLIAHGTAADVIERIEDVLTAHDAAAGTIAFLRQKAFATAMEYGNRITAQVTGQYADVEVQSFTAQEAEARTVVAGGTLPDTALLPPLAAHKGVSLEAYAESVITNADAYRKIAVAAVILRRGADALLSPDLDTPEKLAAAVEALREQAAGYAAQLGLPLP